MKREAALDWAAAAVLAAAFVWRWRLAGETFLELDEAFHLRLSAAPWPQVWRESLGSTHPPLLILLLHWLRALGTSEILLRAPAVIAGTLFPWFVYRWTAMVWNRGAGFAALAILAFAPTLAHLSAVVRAYTLALLFTSVALWCLEKALGEAAPSDSTGSPAARENRGVAVWWMTGFGVALWLGVMAEFATAFFCAAAGCYVVLRWRSARMGTATRVVWVLSQAACIATYAYLLTAQVIPLRAAHQALLADTDSYMAGRFPRAGENPLAFFARGSWEQFDLVFLSPALAWLGLGLFAIGLTSMAQRRRWDLLALFAVPFVLTCLAAYAQTYPYGRGRQTIFLAVFIAAGAGAGVSWLARGRAIPAAAGALVFVPLWLAMADAPPQVQRAGQSRELMREMTAHIRANLPRDSWILVEGNLHMVLLHYLAGDEWPGEWKGSAVRLGGYWLWGPAGEWTEPDQVRGALRQYREMAGFGPDETVWVIDGGGRCALCAAAPESAWRSGGRAVIFSIKAADAH